MTNLSETTLLITGATSGFGLAIAEMAAAQGVKKLYLVGRRQERLDKISKRLPVPSVPIVLDVDQPQAVFEQLSPLSDVTAVVANAGLALGTQPAPDIDIADWQQMVQTNILGLIYTVQALLPQMKKNNKGHIVTMGSIAGNWPYRGGNVYGATKAFVKQFALNLKTDLLGTPIRITNIEPGMAETEFSEVRYHGDTKKAQAVYKNIAPLTATDIANATIWAITQPPHVNINRIEIMPTGQAPGGLAMHYSNQEA